nr:hypothetical protein [Tanacetum cinerariifolium]
MENCDIVPTPMVEQAKLKLNLVGKLVDHTDYRSMIGSLMYVTSSRPDIMFATFPTPMVEQAKLKLDLVEKLVDHTDYQSMIGSLMYVTSSRPDIMFDTCTCARYQANPNEHHVSAVKRIFFYLKWTINIGLWYLKDFGFDLTAYSDTDHAGCHLDRKSTSGSVQFLGDKLMRTQLMDYGFFYDKVPIYYDSKSAITISCNPVHHTRTKHIDVKYHFVKDHVEKGTIELYFVRNKMLYLIPTASDEDSTISEKSFPLENMLFHYKAGLAQVEARVAEHRNRELKYCEKITVLEFKTESRANCIKSLTKELELIKKEKENLDSKLAGFQTASKDLDSLLKSQRLDKNKEGLGYSAVPPPPAQVYSPPKPSPAIESTLDNVQNKNPSVTKTEASHSTISHKPFIKFVKAADCTEVKTNKVEAGRKSFVRYAEMYRRTSKSPNVRGNQRNWNNLKSQQLGNNFVMKNKECFYYGKFDHLSYDCGLWVKKRRACPMNNYTHKSMPPRVVVHKTVRPPMRTTRPNMNVAQPKRTSIYKPAHLYLSRPVQRKSAVRTQSQVLRVWTPVKPNSASIILKKCDYVEVRGRSRENMLFHYKAGLAQVEARVAEHRNRELKYSDCTEVKTNKVEAGRKSFVRYAEMYRRTSKSPNNKACFYYGEFDHLSYDCGLWVKKRKACPKNNYTHKSMPPRAVVHKTVRPPMRTTRLNMNAAQPKRTSIYKPLHLYLSRPVQRKSAVRTQSQVLRVSTVCYCCSRQVNTARPKAMINRRNWVNDIKASACWVWKHVKPNSASIILKKCDYVDVRGRSRSVMAWVPKMV